MILLRYCFLADFIRLFFNSNGAHEVLCSSQIFPQIYAETIFTIRYFPRLSAIFISVHQREIFFLQHGLVTNIL